MPGHWVDTNISGNDNRSEKISSNSVSVAVSSECNNTTVLLVPDPVSSILTVSDLVSGHPLVGILTSLSDDLEDSLGSSEIVLDPLSSLVKASRPSSNVMSASLSVQTTKPCGVPFVPYTGCCDVSVG